VCYDQGGREVTLTDANVCLGYLHPERLPSGLALDAKKARAALTEQIGARLGLPLDEAAYGVYLLGCAGMARAVRAVTIERGRDPRDFVLVAFGGNGPLFAAEMARSLEIGTIVVPPAPGVFSAVGLLEAEVEHHLVRTFLRPLQSTPPAEIAAAVAALEREAATLLAEEGHGGPPVIERWVDCKYQGQSFELSVPLPARLDATLARDLTQTFGSEHERTYGHRADDDPIQLVNLRLTARLVRSATPDLRLADAHVVAHGERPAYFGKTHGTLVTPVIVRDHLAAAWRPGPLLVDEYDATTLVPPGCAAKRDEHGNIVIRVE
jgi:N-methylhydantoinase A